MKLLTYVEDPLSWLAVERWQSEVDTQESLSKHKVANGLCDDYIATSSNTESHRLHSQKKRFHTHGSN